MFTQNSNQVGIRYTVADSLKSSLRESPSKSSQTTVYVTCCTIGLETCEPDVPVQVFPLPLTVQATTFCTSHVTVAVPPERTRRGVILIAVLPPSPPEGGVYTHDDEPAEQYDGDTHVVTLEVSHEEFVYWIVCPEHE